VFERPNLDKLTEVNSEVFRKAYCAKIPVFVETDGACAGNCEKKSAGGWDQQWSKEIASVNSGERRMTRRPTKWTIRQWCQRSKLSQRELTFALRQTPRDASMVSRNTVGSGKNIAGVGKTESQWRTQSLSLRLRRSAKKNCRFSENQRAQRRPVE
jgi:hypothetical protein